MSSDYLVKLSDVEAMLQTLAIHGYRADKHTLAMVKACLEDLPRCADVEPSE